MLPYVTCKLPYVTCILPYVTCILPYVTCILLTALNVYNIKFIKTLFWGEAINNSQIFAAVLISNRREKRGMSVSVRKKFGFV